MEPTPRNTFAKEERICGRLRIEQLFNGQGSKSMAAFPLRAVYLLREDSDTEAGDGTATVSILASVPKRCFKRAVKRNRVKRQIREAYRLNKQIIIPTVEAMQGRKLMLAFIYMDNKLHDSLHMEAKVKNLLLRISEKLARENTQEKEEKHP